MAYMMTVLETASSQLLQRMGLVKPVHLETVDSMTWERLNSRTKINTKVISMMAVQASMES
jgi:hypothetical protein